MAYKIVYGAGQTLSLSSEDKFGSGYGFLEMHRHKDVKDFARKNLERRLMGNSYGFERGPEWGNDERIEISSFQRIDDWYVLSRLRPISESRGRAYFLAEFLLIDEEEAKLLAASRVEGSSRGVLPLDILLLKNEEIWFSGELWDRPGRWLEGSIDLIQFFATGVHDLDESYTRPAFTYRECFWETDRSGGWTPENTLYAMASTQQKFLRTCGERLAVGGKADGACFDLAWNSISLTNFYLDPKSGIDLLFEHKKGKLPYTWTGVFKGIPMHDSIRQEGERSGIIVMTAHPTDQKEVGDEEQMITSGWIRPAPAPTLAPTLAPDPTSTLGPASGVTAPASKTGNSRPVAIPGHKVSVKPSLRRKWIVGVGIAAAFLVFAVWGGFWYFNSIEINKIYQELGDAQKSGNAAEVIRLIADRKIGTELKNEKFDDYLNFSRQFQMLQSYLEKAGETKPAEFLNPEFLTVAGSPKGLALLPPAMTLWQFAKANDGLLKGEPANRSQRLGDIQDRFAAWQDEAKRSELARAASLCGWQDIWEKYEAVMPARNLLRLQTLVDKEEAERAKSGGKESDDDKEFRQRLREVISKVEEREPKDSESWVILASLLSRGTNLTVVETPPVPKPEEPVKQAPMHKGVLAMARLVAEEPDKQGFYAFPKEGFTDVYLADPAILRAALKSAVWQGGALRMPIPVVESIDGLGKVLATSSKVSIPGTDIGTVDSGKESRFTFPSLKEGEEPKEPIIGFVAKNTAGEYECWIYLRGALQEPIDLKNFLGAAPTEGGGTMANPESAEVTVVTSHPYLGEAIIRPETHGAELADVKALGNLLIVRSGRTAAEIAKCEELMSFKGPANVFLKWFGGEATALATPASTFFAGVSGWSEDKLSGSVAADEGTALKKFTEIQSWSAFFNVAAKPGADEQKSSVGTKPDTGEKKKAGVMEARLTSFIVKLCFAGLPKPDDAKEPPALAYFLPSDDPLHSLSKIPEGEWTIENLKSKLATAIASYNPKVKPRPVPPAPPAPLVPPAAAKGKVAAKPALPAVKPETPAEKLDRLVDEARVKNGIAMKQNWENFLKDLVEMEKFVKRCDANFGTVPLSAANVNSALGAIDKAKTDRDWLKALEAKLKGGDLSEVEFKLNLQPKAK